MRADSDNRINLYHGAARERCHTYRRPCMLTRIAEHRFHQIRRAIGNLGLVGEARRAVDEHAQLDDPLDAIEIAQRLPDLRDEHQAEITATYRVAIPNDLLELY